VNCAIQRITLIDNRDRLTASAKVTPEDGHTEREAAKAMTSNAIQSANNP